MHEKIVQRAQEHEQAAHPQGDAMQVALHQLFVLSGGDSDPAEHRAPDTRSNDRCERVPAEVHAHDARGNADQVTDDGEQAGDEHTDHAVVRRPCLGLLDFFRGDQHVATVFHQQRPADQVRGPVHHARANPGANGAGNDDTGQRECSLRVRKIGSRRDHELARHRQDGTLHRHQQPDEPVAALVERFEVPLDQGREHLVHG